MNENYQKPQDPRQPGNIFRDRNIINDPLAPILYSRYSIRFFAIFGSTFLGGILMAMNLYRLKKRTELIMVLLFSFLFTFAAIVLFEYYGQKFTNIVIIFNLIGSAILEELYWNRIIGRHFRYQRRKVWPVALFVILLVLPMVIATV